MGAPEGVRLMRREAELEILAARVHSTDNENERFELELEVEPGLLREASPYDLGLFLAERRFACHGFGGDSTRMLVSFTLERADAVDLASALRVSLDERVDPQPCLRGHFERLPSESEAELPVRFVLENCGPRPVRFLDGGRSRNELGRDNRFHFVVTRDGQPVETREVFDLGGLAAYRTLEPGERHLEELDLAHWATFDRPGRYLVRGRLELLLLHAPESKTDHPRDPRPEEQWDTVVEADLELSVGG